jgi:hypothetical protein
MASTGYYGSVLIEALVVGGVLAALMSMAIVVFPLEESPQRAAFLGFVLGVLTHVSFEMTKANAFYCKNGAACAPRNM